MKFIAIFLAVAVATALAIPAETSVSSENSNTNTVTSNNSNQNTVKTNTNSTNNGNCICPSVNNNIPSNNDLISEPAKRLNNFLKGLSDPILNFIAAALGVPVEAVRDIIKLYNGVVEMSVGFLGGVSDSALKIILDQNNNLARLLMTQYPSLIPIIKPLADTLSKTAIPLTVPVVRDALGITIGTGSNLLGTAVNGALGTTANVAGLALNLIPRIF